MDSQQEPVAARRKGRRPTLADVARLAGVSVSTASRAVTESPRVDASTRQRVHEAVEQLGYRTSRLGRAMVLKRTNILGLLTPEITNPYFPELIVAIENETRRLGYTSILMNINESAPSTESFAETLLDYGVDGLITACGRPDDTYILQLRRAGIPIVAVNRTQPGLDDSSVLPDYAVGGAMVARHLLSLGHERIAYIAGPPGVEPSDARLRGHLEELSRAGVEYSRLLHLEDFTVEAAQAATSELLQSRHRPTAIAVVNDYCALGVLAAAREAGLRVPNDVAVVGYDDIWVSRLPSVGLTTVSAHTERMGQLSVRMIVDLIERQTVSAASIILKPELRVRSTCGALTKPRQPRIVGSDAP